jgi:general secretion pathway protein J
MIRATPIDGQNGFTLVEVLAALAITSLILVSLNLASSGVRQSVERTHRSLADQAALSAAVGIFQRDVQRIVKLRRASGASGFLFEGNARQVIYPVAGQRGASQGGLYLVRLAARDVQGGMQLVRERMPMLPGEIAGERQSWNDAVVLLEGPFELGFAYRAPQTGDRAWRDSWSAAAAMPEQIRLTIEDRATGRLRVPVIVQPLQVDGEPECAADALRCGAAAPEGALP